MSRSVSPMKSGILSSLSSMFKKKDPADQATPMMLGNPANFKYDPIKKKYIFLDEPEEPEEVAKPPPTKQQTQSKSLTKEETSKKEETNQMLVPPNNPTLRGRKKQSKDQMPAISLIPKLPQIIENVSHENELPLVPIIEKQNEITNTQQIECPPKVVENIPSNSETQQPPKIQEEVKPAKDNLPVISLLRINSSENQSKRTGQDSFQDYGQIIQLIQQTPSLSINLALPELEKVQQVQGKSFVVAQPEQMLISQIQNFLYFSQGLQQSDISLNNKNQTSLYKVQQKMFDNLMQQNKQTEWEESLKAIQYQQNQLNYNNQLIKTLIDELQNSQNGQDLLAVEIEKKDFIINQQNDLIKELITKINEFVTYSAQEMLKEEKHQQSSIRQNLQARISELEIELSNSRKETEIFQRQNEMISKDKNSYIKYYEDLRKEMQENINELNSKLDESLNMSTSENQTYMIENQQLKQQIDVISSEKKLIENNLTTTHHIYSELKQEISQILSNEFNAMSSILGISQIPIKIEPAIELRRSLFNFQKDLRQTLQSRENKVQQEIITFKGEIQSSFTKMNQQTQVIEKLQNQNLQYESQINQLKLQVKQAVNYREDMQLSLEKEISELQKIILSRETDYLIQQREQVQSIQDYKNGLNQIRQIFFEDQQKFNENLHNVNQVIVDLKGIAQNKIQSYEQQLQNLTQQLQTKDMDYHKTQALYEEKEIINRQEIHKLNEEINKLNEEIYKFKSIQFHNQEQQKQIDQLKGELKQFYLLNDNHKKLQQEKEQLIHLINDRDSQIKNQQYTIQDIQNKLQVQEDQLAQLEETKFLLSNMEKTLLELSTLYETLQEQNNQLQLKVQASELIESQFGSSKEIIVSLENQILNLQAQHHHLKQDYDQLYLENQSDKQKIQQFEQNEKEFEETKQLFLNLESTLEGLTSEFEENQKQLSEQQQYSQSVSEQLQIKTNQFLEKEDFLKQTICSLQEHILELKQKIDEPKMQQSDPNSEEYLRLKQEYEKLVEQFNQEIAEKTNFIDILNVELKQITQDYQQKEQETVSLSSQIAKLQEFYDQRGKESENLVLQNQSLNDNIKELNNQIVEDQQILIEKDLQIQNFQAKLEEVHAQMNLQCLQTQNSQNESVSKFYQLEDQLNEKKKEIQRISMRLLDQEEQIQKLQMTNDQLKENLNDGRDNNDIQSYLQMIEDLNQLVQELQDKLSSQEQNSAQLELSTLKNLYQQKIKLLEKNTQELEEKSKLIENLRTEVQDKYLLENTIEELFKEKTRYLQQLDQLSMQVSKDDNISKIKELSQKTRDLEEERNILKKNMETMIEDLHHQVESHKKDKETLEGQILQVKAQKEDFEQQLKIIESQKQKELELKRQVNPQNNSGLLNKFASIFVTESEMKKIQQQ